MVGDLDVSEASVSDQLHSSCAQSLGQGDEGLQLGQYLCWYHGSIHCCCCQLTLQQPDRNWLTLRASQRFVTEEEHHYTYRTS